MAEFDSVFKKVSETFGISDLNSIQKRAIIQLVKEKKDVFVNLPTGFGKSLIYQALPTVFDAIRQESGHVVAVVSPLVNLMKDQVSSLRNTGVSAVCLSDVEDEEEASKVEKAEFTIIYGTPEAWLKKERWRNMLTHLSSSKKLCAVAVDEARVIRQWGTSNNSDKTAFRVCYSQLHELRSLAPDINMMALTATATNATKKTIFDVLMMAHPCEIYVSPSKANMTYVVEYMPQDYKLEHYFGWLAKDLKEKRTNCERTIIYCQTIKQCGLIYATLKSMLGNYIFTSDHRDPCNVVLEMLHSCTPETNKKAILNSFQDKDGEIRVLIATIAFGMGVDCKGVHNTVHFGPSKNVEAYIQETGRAGRDGLQSFAFLLYQGILLSHVDKDIKEYVKSTDCRRKVLLRHFDSDVVCPEPLHICCDNCAKNCKCGSDECGQQTKYPANLEEQKPFINAKCRKVLPHEKVALSENLVKYHKSLVMELVLKSAKGQVKTLTNLHFLLGFSDMQISQILDNCEKLFTPSDICTFVEIWDMKHARNIHAMINEVFQDVQVVLPLECNSVNNGNEESEGDTELEDMLDEWNVLMQDDDLFDLVTDNYLSMSQMESSLHLYDHNTSASSAIVDVPDAALLALENVGFEDNHSHVK